MSKKSELEEKLAKLNEQEEQIKLCNLSSENGDYYRLTKILKQIKDERLFTAERKDGKQLYRAFDAYLAHFGFFEPQIKLINKLIKLIDVLEENDRDTDAFPLGTEFWDVFFTIKPDFWMKAVDGLHQILSVSTSEDNTYCTADAIAILTEHPEWKVGYSETRKVPSAIQIILGNAKKITQEDLDAFAKEHEGKCLSPNECDAAKNLLKFVAVAFDGDGWVVARAKKTMLVGHNTFAITKIDGYPALVPYSNKEEKEVNKKMFVINRILFWGTLILGGSVLLYALCDWLYKLSASNAGF